MKKILFSLLLLPVFAVAQNEFDHKIIITLKDGAGVSTQVQRALMKNEFQIKEFEDTLVTTAPRQFKKMPGYAVAAAHINGNTVTLEGFYGMSKVNYFGYQKQPDQYKPIAYYKGSKGWLLLMQIVNDLKADKVEYSK